MFIDSMKVDVRYIEKLTAKEPGLSEGDNLLIMKFLAGRVTKSGSAMPSSTGMNKNDPNYQTHDLLNNSELFNQEVSDILNEDDKNDSS